MKSSDKRKKYSGQNAILYDPFMSGKKKFSKIIGGKTMKSLQRLIMLAVLMILTFSTVKAQLNPVVTMQGFLTDSEGRALPDGTYQSKFRIYDDPTSGTLLWEESHDLSLDHGLYDALLGSVTPLNLAFDKDYWLSVEVDGQGEQQPRIRVGYSFFSIKSLKSDSSAFAENTDSLGGKPASFYDPVTAFSFNSLSGTATDAQIPDDITIEYAGRAGSADSLGGVAAGEFATDDDITAHAADSDVHHSRYTDVEAVSSMGVKNDGNPLNHDKTQSLAFGSITGSAIDAQIPDNITIERSIDAGNADSLAGIAAFAYALKSDIPAGGGGSGAFATISNVTSNSPGDQATDDFVFGSTGLDDDGNGDHTRRMFFDKSKGAFRAGFSNKGEWNEINLGEFSAAFGMDNEASGNWSTAFGRDAEASGNWSIAMGLNVTANANNSIALGSYASTNNQSGSIVFGDASGTTDVTADNMNQFKVRASGGVTFLTNSNMTVGVVLSSGSGTWSTLSDSTMKRNIRRVDTKKILDKVMELPIKQWNYKSQATDIRHIGPMAQDFYTIFEIGENDLTISTIDPSGIALAAIQELYRNTKELESRTREIDDLREEVTELRALVNGLVENNRR